MCKSARDQGGGHRAGQSPARSSRSSERSGYAHLPPHLQPLLDTSDEEKDRRPRTVLLRSGSTEEWAATELCGSRGGGYGQPYTELLQQGPSGDEGDGGVNLSFGLCSGRSSATSRIVIVNNHLDDEGGQVTAIARSSKSPAPIQEASGNNGDPPRQQFRTPWGGRRSHVKPLKQSSMGGRGGKTRACARNGRRGKKAVGKGSDAEADVDAEGGRQFWSMNNMIALIGAKRDQEAHLQGMGTAYTRMKPREWKWLDVEQRLKKVGVDREAEQCGKKRDNLMQQFKKVHHFQGLLGKHDFFQFSEKERLSKGFNFNMDRAVYDEILGSTAKSHAINPKNVADIGAPGSVHLPSATFADPESVGDGDAAAGHDNDEDGSTRGSSQTTGSHVGFGKRKSTRQQTFEALRDCMEKHGALVASTMESNNKRQCSIQIRQCEALEAEVEADARRTPPSSMIRAFRRDCCDITHHEGHSTSVLAILAFVAFIAFVAAFIAFLAILAAFIAFLTILTFVAFIAFLVAFIAFLAILAAFIAFLTILAPVAILPVVSAIALVAILPVVTAIAPVALPCRHVAAASVLGHVNFIAALFDRGVRTSVSSSPTLSSPPSPRSQSIASSPSSCLSPIRAIVQNVFRAVNDSDDIIATPVIAAGTTITICCRTLFTVDAEIFSWRLVYLEVGVSCVMSSRGSGRAKSAAKLAVEATIRKRKGRHVANKQRKLIEGASPLPKYVEDDEWVASQVESDFEEEEEVSLKRKSARRGSGALRIDDVDKRRGGGGRAMMDDVIEVNAAAASARGEGTAVGQQHPAAVARANEAPEVQEVVVRTRAPATPRATTSTDVGVNVQAIGQGTKSRSPAQEQRGAASGGAAHTGEGAREGGRGRSGWGSSRSGRGKGRRGRGGGQGMSQHRGRTTKRW
ncbi:hypothetical protein CBR_g37745 [Chara braunii]|uniref:Myb/SANT-like DNA-binding domain-containing protein n=1 Tax=Chara braunii TaxID=69332 RepID=A0A388LNR3_CHABU|nr:hypothetical protein CBR_g37745 [Chara braunii]|eukprot:GBG83875.1 hypothetical protein CBR_g37745 [Chara braunii]